MKGGFWKLSREGLATEIGQWKTSQKIHAVHKHNKLIRSHLVYITSNLKRGSHSQQRWTVFFGIVESWFSTISNHRPGRFFTDISCISLWLSRLKGGNLSSTRNRKKNKSRWLFLKVGNVENIQSIQIIAYILPLLKLSLWTYYISVRTGTSDWKIQVCLKPSTILSH